MTPDPFTEAARAEAEKRADLTAAPEEFEYGLIVSDFMAGARWARTHLAAQEPDEEEVQAAKAEAWNECVRAAYAPEGRVTHGPNPYETGGQA